MTSQALRSLRYCKILRAHQGSGRHPTLTQGGAVVPGPGGLRASPEHAGVGSCSQDRSHTPTEVPGASMQAEPPGQQTGAHRVSRRGPTGSADGAHRVSRWEPTGSADRGPQGQQTGPTGSADRGPQGQQTGPTGSADGGPQGQQTGPTGSADGGPSGRAAQPRAHSCSSAARPAGKEVSD